MSVCGSQSDHLTVWRRAAAWSPLTTASPSTSTAQEGADLVARRSPIALAPGELHHDEDDQGRGHHHRDRDGSPEHHIGPGLDLGPDPLDLLTSRPMLLLVGLVRLVLAQWCAHGWSCLLYTSDAADEEDSV